MAPTTPGAAADLTVTSALQKWAYIPSSLSQWEEDQSKLDTSSTADLRLAVMARLNETTATAFKARVDMAATLNESANANDYITGILNTEANRVKGLDNTVKAEQHKLRNQLMMYEYLDGYYRTCTNVIIISLYVTLLMLTCAALWRAQAMPAIWFWAAMLLLFLFYLMVMVVWVTALAGTRRDSWHQKQWQVSEEMKRLMKKDEDTTASCSAAGATNLATCTRASKKYRSSFGDYIDDWAATTTPFGNAKYSGKDISKDTSVSTSYMEWAHYNVEGNRLGLTWEGTDCRSEAPASVAAMIYGGLNSIKPESVTHAQMYNEFYALPAASPTRIWAGQIPPGIVTGVV
jgi:hypothetical protein